MVYFCLRAMRTMRDMHHAHTNCGTAVEKWPFWVVHYIACTYVYRIICAAMLRRDRVSGMFKIAMLNGNKRRRRLADRNADESESETAAGAVTDVRRDHRASATETRERQQRQIHALGFHSHTRSLILLNSLAGPSWPASEVRNCIYDAYTFLVLIALQYCTQRQYQADNYRWRRFNYSNVRLCDNYLTISNTATFCIPTLTSNNIILHVPFVHSIFGNSTLNIPPYAMEDFDYIIKRLPQARICFGSSLPRTTMPLETKYKSPLMCRLTTKVVTTDRIDPHNDSPHCPAVSPLGFGPLASRTPRFLSGETSFKPHPSTVRRTHRPLLTTSAIELRPRPVRRSWKPFGRSMHERNIGSLTPG